MNKTLLIFYCGFFILTPNLLLGQTKNDSIIKRHTLKFEIIYPVATILIPKTTKHGFNDSKRLFFKEEFNLNKRSSVQYTLAYYFDIFKNDYEYRELCFIPEYKLYYSRNKFNGFYSCFGLFSSREHTKRYGNGYINSYDHKQSKIGLTTTSGYQFNIKRIQFDISLLFYYSQDHYSSQDMELFPNICLGYSFYR